jgi:hypothetical protein
MDEVLEQALAAGVSPREFFMKRAAGVHKARQSDFERITEEPLTFSLYFTDVDERYTVRLERGGAMEVEDDELDDFPVATVEGLAGDWELVKSHVLRLVEVLEGRRAELERRYTKKITAKILAEFEKIDGSIHVEIVDGARSFKWRVILNHYEAQSGAPSFKIKVPLSLVEDVASGRQELAAAVKAAVVTGDTKFALRLAGFFSKHFG